MRLRPTTASSEDDRVGVDMLDYSPLKLVTRSTGYQPYHRLRAVQCHDEARACCTLTTNVNDGKVIANEATVTTIVFPDASIDAQFGRRRLCDEALPQLNNTELVATLPLSHTGID